MTCSPLVKVSLKWGLIYAGISIVTFVGIYAFSLSTNKTVASIVGVLSIIINVLIFVISNRDYRNTYLGGYIKYGQAFLNSLFVVLVCMFIYSTFTFLLYQVIDPSEYTKMIEEQLLKVDQMEGLPAEVKQVQIDFWVNMTPLKFVAGLQLTTGIVWGLILALIVSIFTRKKNNTFEGAIKEIE